MEVLGLRGTSSLQPEWAVQSDLGFEGDVGAGVTWQFAGYDREDRSFVFLPSSEYRLVGSRLIAPSSTTHFQNAIDGFSRGLEATLQRRSVNGLSGWLAYSFAHARSQNRVSSETYWSDWDQRHTVNAYASYRLSAAMSASTRFRYGSNFPATGYWTSRNGLDYVSDVRNDLRVPVYSRLDLRVNRVFAWSETRLTLFVEVLNAYARANVRFTSGGINGRTTEVTGLFEKMLPRIPSAGFLLEF